jgi:acyl-CoA thioester hydrolase
MSVEIPSDRLVVESRIRVRYAETDAMAVVHHASYVVWLEEGRTELLRSTGTSYRQIEEAGFFVMLSDLQVRYHASARYDDRVIVRTWVESLRSRAMRFAYEIVREADSLLLITATTDHIFVARESGRPVRLPNELMSVLQGALQ